jgi:hypothetical protein
MSGYGRPIVKLTTEQMKALLERVIQRRTPKKPAEFPGAAGMGAVSATERGAPEAAMKQMLNYPPMQTREYGQLRDMTKETSAGMQPLTLPIDEAMRTYMENPGRYSPVRTYNPPAKHVFATQPGGAEDASGALGLGIASETMKMRPVVPPGLESTSRAIQQEVSGANQMGPVATFERMLKQKAGQVEKKPFSSEDLASLTKDAAVMHEVWMNMGGGKSSTGTMWANYLKGSNLRNKIHTAKDYFLSSVVRYNNDPKKFAGWFPREKKLLDKMYDDYAEKTGISLKPVGGN